MPSDREREFDAFCASAFPRLVPALEHVVGDRPVAEELAQEALMRAYQRWERVSQLRSPLGWTVHVGTNLARSLLRRQLAHRRAQRVLAAEPAGAREPDTPLRLTIAAALAQLTVHQREVLVLRYFLGLDTLECGELLGLDPNAVRQRTHRAAGALRRELAGEQHVREPQDER